MSFFDFNWLAAILVFLVPAACIAGMIVQIIRDRRKDKARRKRNTRPIDMWWQMEVKK